MAKKKRYEQNPYSHAAVNGFCSIVSDYINAKKILEQDPDNEDAKITIGFFNEFVAWIYDLTGFSKSRMGLLVCEMLEEYPKYEKA